MKKNKLILLATICIMFISLVVYGILSVANSTNYIYSKMSKKGSVITKSVLANDMNYMRKIENIAQIENENIILNSEEMIKQDFEYFSNIIIADRNYNNKNVLWLGHILNKDIVNGNKTPSEVRLAIRIMLYLKERILGEDLKEFNALYGYVQTKDINDVISFTNGQLIPFKMSTMEFEKIFNQSDLHNLNINEQVNTLTKQWMDETMYFRTYLDGNRKRPLDDLTAKEKLYLVCRDVYFTVRSGGYETSKIIVELFEEDDVSVLLSGRHKELFESIYKAARMSVGQYEARKKSGDTAVYEGTFSFENYAKKELDELFFGKSLSETVIMFK